VDFTITPPNPLPGEVVTFNASACWDPDGGTVDYFDWDFGDTGTGSGMIVTHTYTDYNTPGYDVTLTVTDDDMETWSKTKKLRIWRDVGVVDIWPTDYAWEVTYVDVFHGMIDHYVGIPYMEFIVTSTNFGTVTETFDLTLYMDLDTLVIGDEIVLIDQDGFTLGPGRGSGFGHWGYLLLESVDCGLYTLTAIVESTNDQNPANNMLQTTLYIHAQAEASAHGAPLSPRHFKIHAQGDTLYFKGRLQNIEDPKTNPDGIWARIAFDVLDEMGVPVDTFTTDAVYLMNGEKTPELLLAAWEGITEADSGTYYVSAASEFGWDGMEFPYRGYATKAFSLTIVP
jgi:PKD repeat protein